MGIELALSPFITWFITGVTKFIISTIKAGRFDLSLIGYGGMPSNHAAITSSTVSVLYFSEHYDPTLITVAITVWFIVVMDAMSLRKKIECHAKLLSKTHPNEKLVLRIGHSKTEVAVGTFLGVTIGYVVNIYLS